MLPEPLPRTIPDDILDISWFAEDWQCLPWSPWVSFSAGRQEFLLIPKEPGLYRIRPTGGNHLMYIGRTGKMLHQKLAGLRQTLRRTDLMPWNDPHTEAPGLWAWRDAESAVLSVPGEGVRREEPDDGIRGKDGIEEAAPNLCGYECSAAPLDASPAGLRGMESFLLYRYRQEYGESPLCNFGRFHPRYRRSTNRKENLRGGRLAEGQKDNPAGWPSIPPLDPEGNFGERDWMGLEWTPAETLTAETSRQVAPGAGLFLLTDAGTGEILSIGQSTDCAGRLHALSQRDGDGHELRFSYQILGHKVLPHNLRELENDLIGNFFEKYRKVPAFQFRAGH